MFVLQNNHNKYVQLNFLYARISTTTAKDSHIFSICACAKQKKCFMRIIEQNEIAHSLVLRSGCVVNF
jgi:hypothetical protein